MAETAARWDRRLQAIKELAEAAHRRSVPDGAVAGDDRPDRGPEPPAP